MPPSTKSARRTQRFVAADAYIDAVAYGAIETLASIAPRSVTRLEAEVVVVAVLARWRRPGRALAGAVKRFSHGTLGPSGKAMVEVVLRG